MAYVGIRVGPLLAMSFTSQSPKSMVPWPCLGAGCYEHATYIIEWSYYEVQASKIPAS